MDRGLSTGTELVTLPGPGEPARTWPQHPTLAWLHPYLADYLRRPDVSLPPDTRIATLMEQHLGWPGGLPPRGILTAPGPWVTMVIRPGRDDQALVWTRWLVHHGLADDDGVGVTMPVPAHYAQEVRGIAIDLDITCGRRNFRDPVTGTDHPSSEFLRRYGIDSPR